MKQRFLTSMALFVLCPCLALAQPEQVGLVLGVQGEGELQRGSEMRVLRMAESLFPGDQIQMKSGQASFLFCPSAELVTIEAGALLVLDQNRYQVEAGPKPLTRGNRRCTLPKVALGAESLERVGALRARGFPPIVVYLGGPVSTLRPTFSWEPIDGAVEYEIRIKRGARCCRWLPARRPIGNLM